MFETILILFHSFVYFLLNVGPIEDNSSYIEEKVEHEKNNSLIDKLNGIILSSDKTETDTEKNTKKKKKKNYKKKSEVSVNITKEEIKQTIPPSIPVFELYSKGSL